MNYQPILDAIAQEVQPLFGQGTVASYIPALARVERGQFGIALRTAEGREASAGSARTPFSVQSISKVFTLALAMREVGDKLWERIGREPSGDPFNSLVQLE
ncbi:MAG: glutaminase, partial [Myxococcaceae bacterium]|nr:glutaminase [Myxococcaceae bacterium]